ncbi:MAG: TatD family hydrolase [Lentisphaeria bacterium]|nr:TatD family hydrolase [Lentisphaeria bacterium]
MASDFHTHRRPAPGIDALISAPEYLPDAKISLQLHPWHLPERFTPRPELAGELMRFDALGEVGLDRMRGPELPVQQRYLLEFLRLAQELRKPVVLHVVRCFPELFAALRPLKLRVMVHGFRGTPELLDELWRRGMTVSFHRSVLGREDILRKLRRPAGPFGFESDDDPRTTVRELLDTCGIPNAEERTDQYFADFLEDRA